MQCWWDSSAGGQGQNVNKWNRGERDENTHSLIHYVFNIYINVFVHGLVECGVHVEEDGVHFEEDSVHVWKGCVHVEECSVYIEQVGVHVEEGCVHDEEFDVHNFLVYYPSSDHSRDIELQRDVKIRFKKNCCSDFC